MTSRTRRHQAGTSPLFGVSAEFATPEGLLAGVRALRPLELGRLETHTPVPIPGLAEALGLTGSLAPVTLAAGVVGFVGTMGMCLYATTSSYVFDIGGRPLVSWPAYVVPSLSAAMLLAALATLLAMLFTNRLPHLNHPAFNVPNILRASQDRFFLTITPEPGGRLDLRRIDRALAGLVVRPLAVAQVPR